MDLLGSTWQAVLAVAGGLVVALVICWLLLLGYLALPLDLVPDVLPVIGWADDVIAVVLVLRSVARRAGPEALERHWPGTPEGLAAVRAACGLTAA